MLELDENGKIINVSNKSIDLLKREPFKHSNQEVLKEGEETEELGSFLDSLEPLEDGDENSIAGSELNPDSVELAIQFAEFKYKFEKLFEGECLEAFADIESFFKDKGVESISTEEFQEEDFNDEKIPEAEQSIITSEVEEL